MYEVDGITQTILNTRSCAAIYTWLKANTDKWEGTITISRGGQSVAKVNKSGKDVVITFVG